jgi:hypothetical protein
MHAATIRAAARYRCRRCSSHHQRLAAHRHFIAAVLSLGLAATGRSASNSPQLASAHS